MASSRSRNGQSGIEVLIAIAIIALLAAAAPALLSVSFSESQFVQQRTKAQDLLTEGADAVRQIRNRGFELLSPGTYGLVRVGSDWTLSGTQDVTDAKYTRVVTVTESDERRRDVTVSVTWAPRPARPETVTATTRFTDFVTAPVPTASNCYDEPLVGDWSQPVVVGSGDIGSGNQGTDIALRYPYAFVSGVASSSSKPDLFVFDVSNPAAPQLIESVDIGSGGINSLSIWGDYVFAASANDSKELIVFNAADPANVTVASNLNLSGTADGLSVIAKGDLVAVGREQSSSSEIVFYDMTVPTVPTVVASFQTPDRVNDFATSEDYVYAIGKSADDDLQTFDVTNPLLPVLVSSWDLEDGTEDISIAFHAPNLLFVGNVADRFIVIDASDPDAPAEIGSVATGGEVRDVACLSNELLFIATDNTNQEFQVLDISDIGNIAAYSSINFPNFANGVDFSNGMVFLSVRSNDALRIITSSP